MTILNMAWWWGNNINVPLNWISDLTASSWNWQAVIKRTDVWDLVVNWVTVNEWSCTKLVRKTGSAPASSNDWTPVLTETLENAYSVTGYTNTGLTNGTTYYYWAFSVGTNGLETISNIATVTPTASWWQPWANTIAYYPLNSIYNFTDQSWNSYDLTVSDAVITTLNGVSCASYTWGRAYNSSAPVGTQRTLSAWIYNPWTSWVIVGTWESQNSFYGIMLYLNASRISVSDFHQWWAEWTIPTQNAWHHVLTTADNSTLKVYMDWTLIASWTHDRTDSSTWISAWWKPFTNEFPDVYTWYLSNVILEDKIWSATDVTNYFNQTKSNYGIS